MRPILGFSIVSSLCAVGAACGANGAPAGPLTVPPTLRFELPSGWPARATWPGVGAGRIVLTNNLDDTLSFFDLAALGEDAYPELARVPVGLNPVEREGPHHAAIDSARGLIYVGVSYFVPGGGGGPHGAHGTGTQDGYVLKYRAADGELLGRVRVDRNPGDLTLSSDGTSLFVTHFDLLKISAIDDPHAIHDRAADARLAVIDTTTMTRRAMIPVCPAPHGVRLDAAERTVYVACYSDEIAKVELDRPEGQQVQRIFVAADHAIEGLPRHAPWALAISPADGRVWVGSAASRRIQVIDPVTFAPEPARTIVLRGLPGFGAFSDDGATFYVPYQTDDAVAVIDAATSTVAAVWPLRPAGCVAAHQLVLSPDRRFGLVACEGDHRGPGALVVVALATGEVRSSTSVGVFPDYVGVLSAVTP